MIHAYDSNIVGRAQSSMGTMLDFAVHGMSLELSEYYGLYLSSSISSKFEIGETRTLMGMSGIELCLSVLGVEDVPMSLIESYEVHSITGRSCEYWTGWALAYFQWKYSLGFNEINDIVSIDKIKQMYSPYHEMDIESFSGRMCQICLEGQTMSRLKKKRLELGYSQKELSAMTGIPLKTIQQYEQKQKNINHARVDYLISIAKVFDCDIEALVERV